MMIHVHYRNILVAIVNMVVGIIIIHRAAVIYLQQVVPVLLVLQAAVAMILVDLVLVVVLVLNLVDQSLADQIQVVQSLVDQIQVDQIQADQIQVDQVDQSLEKIVVDHFPVVLKLYQKLSVTRMIMFLQKF